ncbi:MAG TPA: DUF5684 domain-containing protein, partial [Flavisolibacter sp.]|nr:DUF5684 domain-containing protein [Flavisolibacter sp.]
AMEDYPEYGAIDPAQIMTILLLGGIAAIFYIICMWKVFKKAGKPGWAAIIPLYNFYVLLKIVGKPGWWLILLFIPFVNFGIIIWTLNMLSKSFGKDVGFTLGLFFLGIIFWPILAFSNARYQGPYGDRHAYDTYQQRNRFEFENSDPGQVA